MRQHYIRKTQTAVLRKKERRVKEMTVKRGDIFYADLSPVVGSEQGGLRPVLIVQNDVGNKYSPTVIAAAITSRMDKAKLPTHIDVSLKDRAGNGPGLAREVQLYSTDFTNNKPLTIGLEIDNGMFYLYSEGKLFGQIENTEWIGCWLGAMTWCGTCEFTSFKVSEVIGTSMYTVYPDGTKSEPVVVGEIEAPVVETPAEEVVETPVVEAPQTFDVFTICFAAAAVSGLAVILGKKRN